MTETTPEALRLARIMRDGTSFANEDYTQTADMLERQHARIAELEAQLEAIGAGGVEPLRSRRCLHGISEPVRWPKDSKEVREFFRSDFIRAEYVADDHEPCDEDRYYISAHDFLSAVNWWADFPHIPPSPSSADEGGSKT